MDFVWAVREETHDGIRHQVLFESKADAKTYQRKKHREQGYESYDIVKLKIIKGESK
jgi:hypothetical protein